MKPIKLAKFAHAYNQWWCFHIRVDEHCLANNCLKVELQKR
jgi:hypothetical protein